MPCLVRVGDTGRCLLSREVSGHKKMLERWRRQYNTMRPHSALGYRQPAPAAISPASLNRTDHEPSSLISTGSTLGGRVIEYIRLPTAIL